LLWEVRHGSRINTIEPYLIPSQCDSQATPIGRCCALRRKWYHCPSGTMIVACATTDSFRRPRRSWAIDMCCARAQEDRPRLSPRAALCWCHPSFIF